MKIITSLLFKAFLIILAISGCNSTNSKKTAALDYTKNQIEEIAKKYPTPFHIYDEKAIRENAHNFKKAFSWNEGFKEYFAVKACPNPYLIKILQNLLHY